MPSRARFTALVVVAGLALSSCVTPPMEPFNDCSLPEDQGDEQCQDPEFDDEPWLADDLDFDSYLLDGTLDGVHWTGELCALNLIPSWAPLKDGQHSPYDMLQFESNDAAITGGVVTGIWRLGGDIDHPVQITNGTWTREGAGGGPENGSLVVNLEVTESFPAGGSAQRTVTGSLALTAIPTSPECLSMNDVEMLREFLEDYGGPTGAGV
jgi:hypothetical protein